MTPHSSVALRSAFPRPPSIRRGPSGDRPEEDRPRYSLPDRPTAPHDWRADFEALLPRIEQYLSPMLRRLRPGSREEAQQDAVARSLVLYEQLAREGRAEVATPYSLALYAAHQVLAGRRVGERFTMDEPLAPHAQRQRGLRVEQFDCEPMFEECAVESPANEDDEDRIEKAVDRVEVFRERHAMLAGSLIRARAEARACRRHSSNAADRSDCKPSNGHCRGGRRRAAAPVNTPEIPCSEPEPDWLRLEDDPDDPSAELVRAERIEQLRIGLERLPARDATVLRLRYGIDEAPLSCREIAGRLGLTRQRVWQMQIAAEGMLRRRLARKAEPVPALERVTGRSDVRRRGGPDGRRGGPDGRGDRCS